ncbi:hypothetical protein DFH08DRAFT_957124 [Mycena albidolilacea]|uniref:Uncharacterized protein n=1 Tax=Mycena albidolilacea TaxID=1033008 RepID=A0AAD7A8V9_9AGAR|nr:hypothetical protein DFH08DRAFT_957124 [Mycena albidolilacea]
MAALDPALISILHHSVSNKSLRLDISGEMISPAIWTETLAPVYAADEDPFNVLKDQIAADAFVLLCAVLLKTAGSKTFLSWFSKHFGALFIVADQAYTGTTYMARGSQFLREQNQCCFPAVASYTPKKIPHLGLPGGPLILKSLALLRRLEQRLTPLCVSPIPSQPSFQPTPTISAPCCTLEKPQTAPAIPPQTTLLQQPPKPFPSIFVSCSTLEKENILRSQLVSRRKPANKISQKPAPKQGRRRSQSRKRSQRPLFDFSNLPLRAQ